MQRMEKRFCDMVNGLQNTVTITMASILSEIDPPESLPYRDNPKFWRLVHWSSLVLIPYREINNVIIWNLLRSWNNQPLRVGAIRHLAISCRQDCSSATEKARRILRLHMSKVCTPVDMSFLTY